MGVQSVTREVVLTKRRCLVVRRQEKGLARPLTANLVVSQESEVAD